MSYPRQTAADLSDQVEIDGIGHPPTALRSPREGGKAFLALDRPAVSFSAAPLRNSRSSSAAVSRVPFGEMSRTVLRCQSPAWRRAALSYQAA